MLCSLVYTVFTGIHIVLLVERVLYQSTCDLCCRSCEKIHQAFLSVLHTANSQKLEPEKARERSYRKCQLTTHTSLKQLWWLPLLFFPSPVSPPYSPPSPSFLTGSRSFALCVSSRRGKYCVLLFLCKAPKAVSWHQCYASKRKEAIHTSWSLDLWCARNELVASALLPQGRKLLFSLLLLLMVRLSTAISTALWRQGGPLEYWSNAVQSDCGTVRILCSKCCYNIQYTCCSVECFHVSFPVATPRHSTHP